MSILEKKGQRALTHKQQRRHRRKLVTQRRWKAYRTFVHVTQAGYRDPLERAFKGIVGAPSAKQRDERRYRMLMQQARR